MSKEKEEPKEKAKKEIDWQKYLVKAGRVLKKILDEILPDDDDKKVDKESKNE